jgi:6,7-dimethyl-8-ribityllumazine synthase
MDMVLKLQNKKLLNNMQKKILIVIADYYKDISKELLNSAKREIKNYFTVKIIHVPGVFEIPVTISKNINKYNAFIALGCVIKGKTPHFDFISKASTEALMKLSIDSKKPIGNGIITCLNRKQAIERKKKGKEAAIAIMSILSQ